MSTYTYDTRSQAEADLILFSQMNMYENKALAVITNVHGGYAIVTANAVGVTKIWCLAINGQKFIPE